MAIFAISDLHLSLSANKPMDIFKGWENYTERIKENWCRLVAADDTVVIPGDISWAMKLKRTYEDFKFIEELPGKKILLKGNHDLWWETLSKMNRYIEECGFKTISFLHNNCYVVEDFAVCGSRGWFFDDESSDKKVINREAGRIEASLQAGVKTGKEILLFLHYPPLVAGAVCEEIMSVIKKYDIKRVFYGHIHKSGHFKAITGVVEEIDYNILSCDMINFTPQKIF